MNVFLDYTIPDDAKLLKEPDLVMDSETLISEEDKKGKRPITIRDSNCNNETDLEEIHAMYEGEYLNETLWKTCFKGMEIYITQSDAKRAEESSSLLI